MNGSAGSQHDSIATTSSAILQPASPAAAVFAGLADSYEENSAVGLLPRNDGAVVPVHHATLLRFLQEQPGNITLTDEGRSNKARDKLTRLSRAQFSELSTDVYDELLRRGVPATSANSAFLLPRDHYHPKRNQARQKLASLPTLRFKDLVADVFFELQRRFPQVTQAQRPLEPEKRSFQSNTIIPNKSTMVEDDGGDDPSRPQTGRSHISAASSNHHSRRSNQTTSPPPRMSSRSDLSSIRESPSYRGAMSGDSTSYGEAPRDSDQTIKLRNRIRALEDQLGTTSAKLGSLQEENQKLKEARLNPGTDPCLPEIEQELDQARSHIRSLQLELQNSKSAISPDAILREENKRLHEELEEQQRITEDVRQETTDLLDEVRKLAELEGGSWEEKERLERANEELKVELTEWKARACSFMGQMGSCLVHQSQNPTAESSRNEPFSYTIFKSDACP
ncbi:hypothetical protein NEOLI_001253 [Neolecta irregularis DAH-3]|uniref:GIT Spa2 homology (SHD) domain-containing protein n=1 Tax=Neolecta irregularis (strain DAH-3) TaxID=1198029 RepID=A0A1U7LLI3_NEOID|nr:hypothetical protein NEOLI_001253 [Neolecta irregularis DAH-3]|eukprot:OLL23514.1 hypothetical protein NEOLI_001253 [Neolecta irregularis DAH-3]